MPKPAVVLDSDGLIKTTKTGLLRTVCGSLRCFISEEVWNECVVAGKERLYEDAFEIESAVSAGDIKMKRAEITAIEPTLGRGELSTFELWKKLKAAAVITDDRRFIEFLAERGVPAVTPSELLVGLARKGVLDKSAAAGGLRKIESMISQEAFDTAMKKLGVRR